MDADARLGRAGLGLDCRDGEGEGGEGNRRVMGNGNGNEDGNRENIEMGQVKSSQVIS